MFFTIFFFICIHSFIKPAAEDGASFNAHITRKNVLTENEKLLIGAIKDNNIPLVQSLLKAGVEVNHMEHGEWCGSEKPLWNKEFGCWDHLNSCDDYPLSEAVSYSDISIVNALLAAKADVHNRSGCQTPLVERALYRTVRLGRDTSEILSVILKAGADIDMVDKFGYTAVQNTQWQVPRWPALSKGIEMIKRQERLDCIMYKIFILYRSQVKAKEQQE